MNEPLPDDAALADVTPICIRVFSVVFGDQTCNEPLPIWSSVILSLKLGEPTVVKLPLLTTKLPLELMFPATVNAEGGRVVPIPRNPVVSKVT